MHNKDLARQYLKGELTIQEYLRIANERELAKAIKSLNYILSEATPGKRKLTLQDHYYEEINK